MAVNERERLELANCPSCRSTICVAIRRRRGSSARWHVELVRVA
jgi:hypothetical protein